jgi:hypothetical protein
MGTKFILGQEDGTIAGGNARGEGVVDLQSLRGNANQVATGNNSVILGTNNRTVSPSTVAIGNGNTATGYFAVAIGNGCSTSDTGAVAIGTSNSSGAEYGVVSGGQSNIGNGRWAVIGGGLSNSQSSNYGTISGGQSNTASTNTHATVVGGFSNTASGQYSVSGGFSNTASGQFSHAVGRNNVASGINSFVTGTRNSMASGDASCVIAAEYSSASGYCSGVISSYNSAASNSNTMVIAGDYGTAYLLGQLVKNAKPMFASRSGAQISSFSAYRNATLSSGGTAKLSLDGTGVTNLILPNFSKCWNVTVKWVATCSSAGSGTTVVTECAIGTDVFLYKRNNTTVTGVISTITNLQLYQETSMIGAICNYSVGAFSTLDLQIDFVAPVTALNTVFNIIANVEIVEIAI